MYLNNGQIDVFPRLNKRSGAYCWGHPSLPTFVLLNNVPSFDSVSTLAHEMGHAIHTELSKKQSIFYERYSTAAAEVASTLFENFVFDEVMTSLSPKERIIALHDHIADDMGTIFRQIAFFNFEMELHQMIRAEGFVGSEKIAKLMNKHLQSYIGPEFKLDPDDGLFWIRLSHIRSYFYVYTYAYGQLISKALYTKYQQDNRFIEKINQFLSAGGSDTPEHIFKSIGVDTTKPDFWKLGLESIERDITNLEKECKTQNL
jgi:oligoendopeptidase F